MSDQGPWVTKTILELEERVAELTEEIEHLQDSLIRQGKMLSAIVNITKGQPKGNTLHSTHDAVESVERLQARVAEKCDAPVGWIDPEKYKAACESKMKFFKTIKELREQNEKLQARVAELYDLIKYAQVDSGVCMCGDKMQDHNQSSGHMLLDIWDHAVEQINKEGSSEAFILRKQVEAVEDFASKTVSDWPITTASAIKADAEGYVGMLRDKARIGKTYP